MRDAFQEVHWLHHWAALMTLRSPCIDQLLRHNARHCSLGV
eukprot:gene43626-65157_t